MASNVDWRSRRPKVIDVTASYDLSFQPTQEQDTDLIIDTTVRLLSKSPEGMAVIEVRREVTFSPAGPFRLGVTARVEATDIKKKKLSRKDVSRMATPAVSKIALMLALLSEQLTGGMPLITPPTASEDDVRLIGDSEQVVAKGTT